MVFSSFSTDCRSSAWLFILSRPVLVKYMFVRIVHLTSSLVPLTLFFVWTVVLMFIVETIDRDRRFLLIQRNQVKRIFNLIYEKTFCSFKQLTHCTFCSLS